MYQIRQTDVFDKWLNRLRDRRAKARIIARLDSARLGNLGDCKSVGPAIREMRIHFGPGYRVYFSRRKNVVLLLLCGGSKTTQRRDIERAKKLLDEIEE
ncbi:type II toxin-antitoxin system RelE/ParE family toxin [Wenzhouxiangella limi]|uniref:Type II toxin-antitoxin system RelE/ParE family toxin n=1 Tax=Wenzhouxiangella limi TaxID=2707351 RepID=A0A845USF9_9GAMM|nr:type II toxin-antitoxin system RelE/ParE family toxin [Wenzhouxiangella limi]